MAYQVTARKWRPQTLSELVGQDHISQSLTNAIQSGRIAHGYLFSGPRGVGKTSCARILAKSLNCEKGSSITPCQKCSNCIEITKGSSYDVIEIDGASNRKIDDVREVRENVKYLPSKSKHKIIIIDEVHMLTDQAFNALLKTLEEPPEHVIFIFATTEAHKVKITIRSRCQHYHFRRIPTQLIKQQLEKIADEENIKIDEKGLYQIAKAGDGSMRDSQSLFDQVIAYGSKDLSLTQVEEILGVFSEENYFHFLDFLVEKNIIELIKFSNRLLAEGESLYRFTLGLVEQFRNILIIKKCGESESSLLDIPLETIGKLKQYSDHFTDEQLLEIINLIISLNQELKKSIREDFLFESYLFKLVNYENFIQPSQILKRLENIESNILDKNSNIIVKEKKLTEKTVIVSDNKDSGDNISISQKFRKEDWQKFLDLLSKEKPRIAGNLQHAKGIEYNNNELIIFFEELFFFEEVAQKENISKIESFFNKLYNEEIKAICKIRKQEGEINKESNKETIKTIQDTFNGTIISGEL